MINSKINTQRHTQRTHAKLVVISAAAAATNNAGGEDGKKAVACLSLDYRQGWQATLTQMTRRLTQCMSDHGLFPTEPEIGFGRIVLRQSQFLQRSAYNG
jgi:hypothetical protein